MDASAEAQEEAQVMKFPVVKTFSATQSRDRDRLGDEVTEWLRENENVVVEEIRTHQSSDQSFHCLSVVVIGHTLGRELKP